MRTVLPVSSEDFQQISDTPVFGPTPINVLDDMDSATEAFIQNLIMTNLPQLSGMRLQEWENFFFDNYELDFDWDTTEADFPRSSELEQVLRNLVEEEVIPEITGLE